MARFATAKPLWGCCGRPAGPIRDAWHSRLRRAYITLPFGYSGIAATHLKDRNTKAPTQTPDSDTSESANRRRVGRVVHDDRGAASVEWIDAPVNQPRTILEIEDTVRAQRRLKSINEKAGSKAPRQDSFNPYQRVPGQAAAGPKRDLNKLSKWIKMMREIEERKALDNKAEKKPTEE